ncbi:hypothetical protein PIB30_043968 [Stylosanthes scabra]|uniref:Ribonuclease H1 N-terminal domain-containing protein n=1 Tax=Stylosanthes scabra TaxID=79078 RepID=A0ABU6RFS1_9FABA|nr:hypothetical protein [Stylosanthes scabra]
MEDGEPTYYAVKAGRVPGIYTSWASCKRQVHRYKNAYFKSFSSLDDAMTYMRLGMAMFETMRDPIYQPSNMDMASASMSALNLAESVDDHGSYSSAGSSSSSADPHRAFLYDESMEGLLMRVCEREGLPSPVYKPVIGRTEDGKRVFGFEVRLVCAEKGLSLMIEADLRANEAKAREDAAFNMLRSFSKATGKKINDYMYRLMLHEVPGTLAARVQALEAEKATLMEQLAALYGIPNS